MIHCTLILAIETLKHLMPTLVFKLNSTPIHDIEYYLFFVWVKLLRKH